MPVCRETLAVAVRLAPGATMPAYGSDLAAGADLAAYEDCVLAPGERRLVRTGVSIELPRPVEDWEAVFRLYEAQVRPRSGLALKHGVTVLNAPGTIDAGEMM